MPPERRDAPSEMRSPSPKPFARRGARYSSFDRLSRSATPSFDAKYSFKPTRGQVMKTSVQTASKSKKRPPTTSSPADDARRWREGATTPRCLQNAATRSSTASPARRASGSSRRKRPSGAGPPPTNRSAGKSRPACVEIKLRTPTPSTRRRPVTASARWLGGSTPSTRRRPLNCGSSTA